MNGHPLFSNLKCILVHIPTPEHIFLTGENEISIVIISKTQHIKFWNYEHRKFCVLSMNFFQT